MKHTPLVLFDRDLVARVSPGKRDKVLWLHGYTIDSSAWSELWELLPDWDHTGIDLPGHGYSLPLPASENLPSLARRVARSALARGIEHIAALSFGTLLGLQIIIEFPDSFRSLTLGAPALGGGPQDSDVGARYEELAAIYRREGFTPELRRLWMQSPPNIFKGAEAHPALWNRLWGLVGKHPWWELQDGSYGRLSNHRQSVEQLRNSPTPTLVLVGDNELPAFKRCGELIRRYLPNCERRYLPSLGHLCLLEDPRAVHNILEEHWTAHSRKLEAYA
ncbi:MAG: alpha/beta hydrolase [Acidobacteriaceae bacterium]|nr:alpha/beta hydrolase [Acidobacteriaceae bacterium]